MSHEKGYKKLLVWKKADELARAVYKATLKFPKEEVFGITSQLRRAVLSIPTNLVEGQGRQNRGELRQFVNFAMGSAAETEYLLDFCVHLGYLDEEALKQIQPLRHHVGALLWRFYQSIKV